MAKGKDEWLFAINFVKHPTMLGSVIPSSRWLIRSLLAPVDWERARYFVEYGPGVGTITRHILKRMHPEAKLLVLEINDDFVRHLNSAIDDPRLVVRRDSAASLGTVLDELDWPHIDYAVSGIPFSIMSSEDVEAVLKETRARLPPQGEFLVYQFSRHSAQYLHRSFDDVSREFVLRNVPPVSCYRARSNGGIGPSEAPAPM
ncbi:class I SAM-dependent methyltransferase [Marinobacter fonticola]|uniref:class I SAM-dependent methyltransferase n=1 Tax=Marinobacter fonticola TaxID=2603215 RepID=UPI0011E87950|nr:class I SAM-dependent methyltransferase [Marinobacter fonticola]